MDEPEVFTRYDIRGGYPDEIDEEFSLRFGKSIGKFILKEGLNKSVAVGYDTRKSSIPIKDSLISGILSMGVDVLDVGVGPTDKVSFLGNKENCGLSIMITASHHSWERNGIKLLYSRGNGFSNEDLQKVKEIFTGSIEEKQMPGKLTFHDKSDEEYIKGMTLAFEKYFSTIDAKVIVDCCNGAAYRSAPAVLRGLGAEVVEINCSKEVNEELPPEPTENNRSYLKNRIKEEGADLAVGYDPDADRVFAFDNDGKWIDGDELFCILSKIAGPEKIVASIDTSQMLEETIDADVFYTRVGDIFVSEKGVEVEADLLGEPNGHYAITDFSWYNSGVFSSLLLAALADKLPRIREEIPKFFTEQITVKTKDNKEKIDRMENIIEHIRKKYDIISEIDGIKFTSDGCRSLIRPSET